MSHSRKKHGIIKDKDRNPTNWYNKKFRRVNKQRIKQGKEPLLAKELVNPYDICDWTYRWRNYEDFYERSLDHRLYWRTPPTYKDYLKAKRDFFNK